MSTTRLPELPEPSTRYYCNKCGQAGDTQRHHRPHGPECNYLAVAYKARGFTANQMHAYGLAVWKAAMQHAAEAVPTNWCDELLTGKHGIGQPPYHCPDIERLLSKLRAAILALPLPEQGGPQ